MAPEFKKDKHGFPDPLHIELPHTHKKLFELVYVLVIIAAIILIAIFNASGILNVEETNTSGMLLLFLSILLTIILIEKSMVHHKPVKSSS